MCFVFVLELEVCFVVPRLKIGIVKDYIREELGIALEHQILCFQGKRLNDSRTLHECGLYEGSKGEIRSQSLMLLENKVSKDVRLSDAWCRGQELMGRDCCLDGPITKPPCACGSYVPASLKLFGVP